MKRLYGEEASTVIAGNPKDYFPPEPAHIAEVLRLEEPVVVISFTRTGFAAIKEVVDIWNNGRKQKTWMLSCRHPAARGNEAIEQLRVLRAILDDMARNGMPAEGFAERHGLLDVTPGA